ncbi:MAG TPA: FAD-dependent monooxygenase [Thermohalobaculum sp.]|nr:FAD-dependent monooxygenase [Thermohalobaculum sp.]
MKQAVIAGGGIAGTAAALALAREGWAVTVCEAAPGFAEVGAGLQMSPNAAKVLRWLGVLDAVAARAFRPEAAELRDGASGALIYRAALGAQAEARWGAPYLHVHRADLLEVLVDAAQAAGARLRTGARVASYVLRSEGPAVKLEPGATRRPVEPGETRETLAADLVIGADGLHSALRAQLNGPEEPVFAGQVAWRGTIPAGRLPAGLVAPNATVWAGPGRHLVTYWLRGGALVNFVAVESCPEWTAEGWSAPGDPERLRRGFAGWHSQVTGLLEHVEETFLWGLFTRPAQVRWVDGPVVLIGDAAHPMLPFLAQGAAMALEDAAVLVRALQAEAGAAEAAAAFEERRWHRVTRVQERSIASGRLYHEAPGPVGAARRGLVRAVSRLMPGLAAGRLDRLYGYDATEGLG